MSQENVERVIKLTEAFNRLAEDTDANPRALRDWLGVMDPEIQFEPQQSALQGSYVGHEGAKRWLADIAEHYKDGEIQYADVRDLEDRVLALGTLRFAARGSGIEIEVPVAIVASFRNGLMSKFRDYGDKHRALEAVGLSD